MAELAPGWLGLDTGVEAATKGVASVHLARPQPPGARMPGTPPMLTPPPGPSRLEHTADIKVCSCHYVLAGTARVAQAESMGGAQEVGPGACVTTTRVGCLFVDSPSPDFQLLSIRM